MTFRPRSYHPRRRKLTVARAGAWAEFGPALEWHPGERPNDTTGILLDIGIGMGEATADWAERHPQHLIVGVDIHTPGMANLTQLALVRNLMNVRVVHGEAVELLEGPVALQSLDGVRLLFPDPWPKHGQRHRRLVQPPFVALLGGRIRAGGHVWLATDDDGYANQMADAFAADDGFRAVEPEIRTATRFEIRGREAGRTITDLAYVRTG